MHTSKSFLKTFLVPLLWKKNRRLTHSIELDGELQRRAPSNDEGAGLEKKSFNDLDGDFLIP